MLSLRMPINSRSYNNHIAVLGVMGDCWSIPKPAPDEVPDSHHKETLCAMQHGHEAMQNGHDTQTTDQQPACQPGSLFPQPKPQETVSHWQQEHVSQSTLQQQITLQSQEIAKLREQVIDLQAYRQQQQKQHQRAAYIKSQIFPAGRSHKMQIPQDCCAAAMACCIAIEEMKADLKAEGQLICKQLDTLTNLDTGKGHSNTLRSLANSHQPSVLNLKLQAF